MLLPNLSGSSLYSLCVWLWLWLWLWQADVLPSAEDFARDANLMNVPGDLIGALCPLFTGHMLGVFQQNKAERRKAYTWFFLLSAITGAYY